MRMSRLTTSEGNSLIHIKFKAQFEISSWAFFIGSHIHPKCSIFILAYSISYESQPFLLSAFHRLRFTQ